MSRKFKLINECNHQLHKMRTGVPSTRLIRRRIMHSTINDLFKLGIAPVSLNSITTSHIKSVVNHWKQQGLSNKTITNKLGVIRGFIRAMGNHNFIPSNQALDLISAARIHQPTNNYRDLLSHLDRVNHPMTRTILAFQLFFGLTKTESVRINISLAVNEGNILIDRKLASNNKDRYVPIVCIQQEQAIIQRKNLLSGQDTLTQITTEGNFLALYKADMEINQLNPNYPYRAYYAKNRHASLQANHVQNPMKKLQAELGIGSKYRLMELL